MEKTDPLHLEMSSSQQGIVVNIDANSVTSLIQSNAALMVFKAVSNSDTATRPLLWARAPNISAAMTIDIDPDVTFLHQPSIQ